MKRRTLNFIKITSSPKHWSHLYISPSQQCIKEFTGRSFEKSTFIGQPAFKPGTYFVSPPRICNESLFAAQEGIK